MTKKISIPIAVRQLLSIVQRLRRKYPNKRFTLDGRLVGDIGEVLVAATYEVELFDKLQKHHDGRSSRGWQVQIKTTMQKHLTFPADHVPKYYLGIKLYPDGHFDEVFNGPGRIARQAIRGRARPKTNLHSISVAALAVLNRRVPDEERIARR
jgi:hypothetical protein